MNISWWSLAQARHSDVTSVQQCIVFFCNLFWVAGALRQQDAAGFMGKIRLQEHDQAGASCNIGREKVQFQYNIFDDKWNIFCKGMKTVYFNGYRSAGAVERSYYTTVSLCCWCK
ncbi:uncharacterized protein LOC123449705 [Hordeum vulgare subsp. vulgare]|uniref:uncharacterized protein LOC123449705 n=1 Tax=Hordeum vulgare subsp. vulgare TaxID=112509 RepID=UPI001D1A5568|nr:uncharacterized protein LOC123449705 [Hordeum vulgare subsp. vulgare]